MANAIPLHSQFLDDLPAEIRNEVYSLALTFDNAIDVKKDSLSSSIALLQTCKQIRAEASAIFYAANTFCINCIAGERNQFAKWLKTIDLSMGKLMHLHVKLTVHAARLQSIGTYGLSSRNLTADHEARERKLITNPIERLAQRVHRAGISKAHAKVTTHSERSEPVVPDEPSLKRMSVVFREIRASVVFMRTMTFAAVLRDIWSI